MGSQGGHYPPVNPYEAPPPQLQAGRDEILIVSDDRVMRVQMTVAARTALGQFT